ncbi:MAG TPA: ABC transporter ATP-binding protein [Candidatus Saccharimonadales bacterium]|nr:ABC transporter ATP-binding protein [Candidatus Saccharimonadales bacterium]
MKSPNSIISNNYSSKLEREGYKYSNVKDSAGKSNEETILKAINISKVYESPAGNTIILKDINFTVKKGEFVSIVGPSGSGKSTLLNIIGALDRPTTGKIYIRHVDIFSLSDRKIAKMRNQLIGFIFQSYNLINRTSVLSNVEIPAIIAGIGGSETRDRALNLLSILGIKEKAGLRPLNLSGGQQQRVAIARALMNNPAIILADEPTGNLDTKTGQDVFKLLKMISSKYNRTIVMVTHNPDLAQDTDKTIYVRDGKIEKEIIN